MKLEKHSNLTQEVLKQSLHYAPETGVFTWLVRPIEHFKNAHHMRVHHAKWAHKEAGAVIPSHGYRIIKMFGKSFKAHRLAHLYMTGKYPTLDIGHENQVESDNRWANLQEVTDTENMRNRKIPSDCKTLIMGVTYRLRDRNPWQAKIGQMNKLIWLGGYDNLLDAACARKSAENRLGYHPNHGPS